MAWHRWLARPTWVLCVGLVAVSPGAALAQLPDCETQGPLTHFKTDSPDPVIQGNDLTYTIELSSFLEATCFDVDDPLPAATTFESLVTPPGWTCTVPPVGSNGTVHCSKGPNGPATLTLVVRVDPGFAGVLSNVATVSYGVALGCPPTAPDCTVQETTTVDVPVELVGFGVE